MAPKSLYHDEVDEAGIKDICIAIVPFWNDLSHEHLSASRLEWGLTNVSYKVEVENNGSIGKKISAVKVCCANRGSVILYDLEAQCKIMRALADVGCCAKVHGNVPGGYIAEWIRGAHISPQRSRFLPTILQVAVLLGRFHKHAKDANVPPEVSREPVYFERLKTWGKYLRETLDLSQYGFDHDGLEAAVKQTRHDIEEYARLHPHYLNTIQLCHNDLHNGNTIENRDYLRFVDFDCAGFNYVATDIAGLFTQWWADWSLPAPIYFRYSKIDYDISHEAKILFASVYLSVIFERNVSPNDAKLISEFLYTVKLHQQLASLFWCYWAFVMSTLGGDRTDFDYIRYAKARYDGYVMIKREIMEELM